MCKCTSFGFRKYEASCDASFTQRTVGNGSPGARHLAWPHDAAKGMQHDGGWQGSGLPPRRVRIDGPAFFTLPM